MPPRMPVAAAPERFDLTVDDSASHKSWPAGATALTPVEASHLGPSASQVAAPAAAEQPGPRVTAASVRQLSPAPRSEASRVSKLEDMFEGLVKIVSSIAASHGAGTPAAVPVTTLPTAGGSKTVAPKTQTSGTGAEQPPPNDQRDSGAGRGSSGDASQGGLGGSGNGRRPNDKDDSDKDEDDSERRRRNSVGATPKIACPHVR